MSTANSSISEDRLWPPRVGATWSPSLASFIAAHPGELDHVEVAFEQIAHDPRSMEGIGGLPTILHCASLSMAGFVPPPEELVTKVAHAVETTGTPWVGEHLAYVLANELDTANTQNVGFTVCPQLSEETLEQVLANLESHRRRLGCPLILENPPQYFAVPGSSYSLFEFIGELCARSDLQLLLDLTHLHVAAHNMGFDPFAALEALPLERVLEVHISGASEQSGALWDDHAVLAPPRVFELFEACLARARPSAVTLEYNWLPRLSHDTLRAELDRVRELASRVSGHVAPRVDDAKRPARPRPSSGMGAARAHDLVAGCLVDPSLIDDARERAPDGPLQDLLALDLTALGHLAGFITKVRHNPLRRSLPATLRALARVGLEIDAFAAYAPRFARLRARGPLDDERRIASFSEFLESWLHADHVGHAVVRDVLHHELTLREIRKISRQPAASSSPARAEAVWRVRGTSRILETRFDPCELIAALASDADPKVLARLEPSPRYTGYWWDGQADEIAIFELDPLSALVLGLVDGERSAGEIAVALERVAGTAVPVAAVTNLLAEAVANGLLELEPAADERAADPCV
jgi:uncharacterized protein (UPF0276 family)